MTWMKWWRQVSTGGQGVKLLQGNDNNATYVLHQLLRHNMHVIFYIIAVYYKCCYVEGMLIPLADVTELGEIVSTLQFKDG